MTPTPVAEILVPRKVMQDVLELRRDIHAYPELGFEEVRTSGIVADRLRRLGYEVRTGIAQTGVLGILRTGRPGRTVLLRADMDALPVQERNGLPFASTIDGKMHACGHDGHVAILLGAAGMIAERKDALCGTIVLCFQPAEEGKGGAAVMVAEGILDDPHVDVVYGLHVWSEYQSGVVLTASWTDDGGERFDRDHHQRQRRPRRAAGSHDRPDRHGGAIHLDGADGGQPQARSVGAGGHHDRSHPQRHRAQRHTG